MKPINHFKPNRPVHLALRDTYYQQATHLLQQLRGKSTTSIHISDYEAILFLLRTARDHGGFASRNHPTNNKNAQFNQFINLLAGNVKAILSMQNLKKSVEAKDGFFLSFLDINRASVALQAEEYERRTRDIICCMLGTLDLSEAPYKKLLTANWDEFSALEKERYEKAKSHYQEILKGNITCPTYKKRMGQFS